MRTDQFFRQLERRSERELYYKTSRIVYTSQRQLMNSIKLDKKKLFGRRMAIEVLWFFIALLVGLILGYLLYLLLENETNVGEMMTPKTNEEFKVLYFSCGICFIGVYVTRLVMWSIQKL